MIKKLSDVGFTSPHKYHSITENLLREIHLLLHDKISTNVSIGVIVQSTLRKIPWRFLPQVEGLPSAIRGSEITRVDCEGG